MSTPTYLANGTQTQYTLLSNVANTAANLLYSVGNITLGNVGNYYNYPPQIVITSHDDGYGAEATAYLNTATGKVSAINVYYPGSGYQNPPTIGIVGGGTPTQTATATATLSGGYVTTVNMNETGMGYTAATVTFSAPPTSWGTTATGTARIDLDNGAILGITITNRGSGYVTPPTVTITGTNSAPASVGYVSVASIILQSITVTDHGLGYTSAPSVTITPTAQVETVNVPPLIPAGATAGVGYSLANITVTDQGQGYTSNANVTVHIRGEGSIGTILVANSGAGYSNTPTVIIGSPNNSNGHQAVAVARLADNSISSVLVTNSGTGYTQPPSVSVTAAQNNYPTYSANLVAVLNTGTGANATATLLPYYTGNGIEGGSYYLRNLATQVVTWDTNLAFVGNIYLEGSLSPQLAGADWFDIKKLNLSNSTSNIANTTGQDYITGKFKWVRARVEDFAAGTINSVKIIYPYVG